MANLNEMIRKVQPCGCACSEKSPLFQITVISFPPFPRVTMGTSLHSLEHTSPSCSDICKAFGSLPPRGTGRRAFPYVGLPALFIHVCICVCAVLFCFVCFLLGFGHFILEAPGSTLQTWLRLHQVPPGKRALELSPPSFWYGSESRRKHSPFSCQRVGGKHSLFILKRLRRLCKDRGVMS